MKGIALFCKHFSRRSSSGGFSLVEVMIATGLSFLLFALMLALHQTSYKVWRKSSERSHNVGRLQAALGALKSQLRRSAYDGLSIAGDGSALSILVAEDQDGNRNFNAEGAVIWNRWVVYYKSDTSLLRKTAVWGGDPVDRVIPVPLPNFPSYLDGNGRVLVEDLKSLNFTNPTGTKLIQIGLETTGTKNTRGLKLTSTVRPRN